ncbi:hypothetical protein ACWKSP_37065 [Micromonosporaceae bacterium Da 78-11]
MPESLRGVASLLLVPLAATVLSGGLMLAVIGPPVAAGTAALGAWLSGLGGSSAVLLGAALGAMAAADLGGPLNKTAYTFAVTAIATGGGRAHGGRDGRRDGRAAGLLAGHPDPTVAVHPAGAAAR